MCIQSYGRSDSNDFSTVESVRRSGSAYCIYGSVYEELIRMGINDNQHSVGSNRKKASSTHQESCYYATLNVQAIRGHFVYIGSVHHIWMQHQGVRYFSQETSYRASIAGVSAQLSADSRRNQQDNVECPTVMNRTATKIEQPSARLVGSAEAGSHCCKFTLIMRICGGCDRKSHGNPALKREALK